MFIETLEQIFNRRYDNGRGISLLLTKKIMSAWVLFSLVVEHTVVLGEFVRFAKVFGHYQEVDRFLLEMVENMS